MRRRSGFPLVARAPLGRPLAVIEERLREPEVRQHHVLTVKLQPPTRSPADIYPTYGASSSATRRNSAAPNLPLTVENTARDSCQSIRRRSSSRTQSSGVPTRAIGQRRIASGVV